MMKHDARIYKRILARLFDIIVSYLLFSFIATFLYIIFFSQIQNYFKAIDPTRTATDFEKILGVITIHLMLLIPCILYELIMYNSIGKTFGKMIFNIRYDFGKPVFINIKIILHIICFYISVTIINYYLFFLFAIPFFLLQTYFYKKQTLYDLFLGLRVIQVE